MPMIITPGNNNPSVINVSVPVPVPMQPKPVAVQRPPAQPTTPPTHPEAYQPRVPVQPEQGETHPAIILPHSGVGLSAAPDQPEQMRRRYARGEQQLKPGEMDAEGGSFQPDKEPDLAEFVRNRFAGDYGYDEPTTPMTSEHGFILPDGAPVRMGSGGTRGEDHRSALPYTTSMRRWGWPEEVVKKVEEGTRTPGLVELMKRGRIARIHIDDRNKSLYVHFVHRLTPAQKLKVSHYVRTQRPPEVTLEPHGHMTGGVVLSNPEPHEVEDVMDKPMKKRSPHRYARVGGLTKIVSGHYQYVHPSGKKYIITRDVMRNGKTIWLSHKQTGSTPDHYDRPFNGGGSLAEAVKNCEPGEVKVRKRRYARHVLRYAAKDIGDVYEGDKAAEYNANKQIAGPPGRHPISVVTARYPLLTDPAEYEVNPLTHGAGRMRGGKPVMAADPESRRRIIEVAASHGVHNADFQKEVLARYVRDLPGVFGDKLERVKNWLADPHMTGRGLIGTKESPGLLERNGITHPGGPGFSWHTAVPDRSGKSTGLHVHGDPDIAEDGSHRYHGVTNYDPVYKRLYYINDDGRAEDVTDVLKKRPSTGPKNQPGLDDPVRFNTLYAPNVVAISHHDGGGLQSVESHLHRRDLRPVFDKIGEAVSHLLRKMRGGVDPRDPDAAPAPAAPSKPVLPDPQVEDIVRQVDDKIKQRNVGDRPGDFPPNLDDILGTTEPRPGRSPRKQKVPVPTTPPGSSSGPPAGDPFDEYQPGQVERPTPQPSGDLFGDYEPSESAKEQVRREGNNFVPPTKREPVAPVSDPFEQEVERARSQMPAGTVKPEPPTVEPRPEGTAGVHSDLAGTRLASNLQQMRGDISDPHLHKLIDRALRGPGEGDQWGDAMLQDDAYKPFAAIKTHLNSMANAALRRGDHAAAKTLRGWRDAYQWDRVGQRLQADRTVGDSLTKLMGGPQERQFKRFIEQYVPGVRQEAGAEGGKSFKVKHDFVSRMNPEQRAGWEALRGAVKAAKLPGLTERETGGPGSVRALDQQILKSLFRNAVKEHRTATGREPTKGVPVGKQNIEQYRRRFARPRRNSPLLSRLRSHFRSKMAAKDAIVPPVKSTPSKAPAGGIVVRSGARGPAGTTYPGGEFFAGGKIIPKVGKVIQ